MKSPLKFSSIALAPIMGLLVSTALATPTVDGTLTDGDYTLIDDNTGGPSPGFGAGHEINALYAFAESGTLYLGIAGNVQDGNRMVVFIDSRAGGYTNGDFGRTSAPQGVDDFNSGTSFDAGFEADYALVVGTNAGQTNFFVDLYTLAGTSGGGGGSSLFIGDISDGDVAANVASGSTTQGIEVALTMSTDGVGTDLEVDGTDIDLFAMYMSDGAFLSNMFISPAGGSDGNYGNGAVDFGAAAPDPVNYSSAALPVELDSFLVE